MAETNEVSTLMPKFKNLKGVLITVSWIEEGQTSDLSPVKCDLPATPAGCTALQTGIDPLTEALLYVVLFLKKYSCFNSLFYFLTCTSSDRNP